MKTEGTARQLKADLQTAQNRMFPFVCETMNRPEMEGIVAELMENPAELHKLYDKVRRLLFDLLNIDAQKRKSWHIGIADSGKRTIEILVNYLCPPESSQNGLLDTENYVGFNKFSAATALENQKKVAFARPFTIDLGRALSVNSEDEFSKLPQLFEGNRYKTLWVPWNSTSTGVKEDIGRIVECRNRAGSKTLLVADAASLRLFSNDWRHTCSDKLPDVFFFSLRKQGLPYEGPNDEAHQARNSGALIIFNDRALNRARELNAPPIYQCPGFEGFTKGSLTRGEQRSNHVKHLLKLDCVLEHFQGGGGARIDALDDECLAAQRKILAAFSGQGKATPGGFTLFADTEAVSDSAYIVGVPDHTNARSVISHFKEQGILLSPCLHPRMDSRKYFRFAFYPGNTVEEIDQLLERLD